MLFELALDGLDKYTLKLLEILTSRSLPKLIQDDINDYIDIIKFIEENEIDSVFDLRENSSDDTPIQEKMIRLYTQRKSSYKNYNHFMEDLVSRKLILHIKFAYKIIPKRNSQESYLRHEIEMYKKFNKLGINTFIALDTSFDIGDHEVNFTIWEQNLQMLTEKRGILKSDPPILNIVLNYVYLMHTKGLIHGDLHFQNIGFINNVDNELPIIFDLVRARDNSEFELDRIRADYALMLRSLYALIRISDVEDIDYDYVIASLESYREKIVAFVEDKEYAALSSYFTSTIQELIVMIKDKFTKDWQER